MMRSKVRMFLRHTWLVAVLGTLFIVGLVWAGGALSTVDARRSVTLAALAPLGEVPGK